MGFQQNRMMYPDDAHHPDHPPDTLPKVRDMFRVMCITRKHHPNALFSALKIYYKSDLFQTNFISFPLSNAFYDCYQTHKLN